MRIPFLALLVVLCASDPARAEGVAQKLVEAARAQVGVTVGYDPAYRRLSYPAGDIAIERGVCTDVLIRAYRALGLDLQVAVHEDMKRAWNAYPKHWGLRAPDSNIDHRRVPNLATWLRRQGAALEVSDDASDYEPGDLVTWRLASGVPHIGMVSDQRIGERPLVIHNIGAGAREEDVLFAYTLTGRFRYLPGGS